MSDDNRLFDSRLSLVKYLPVLGVLLLLTEPIPAGYIPDRELAHYFQSVAFLRNGVESYTYITLRESDAALHLYSLLSAPFVAIGYEAGGRLVSVIAAVAATIILGKTARDLFGPVAGIVGPLLLWANPFFFRFSWTVMPEALSMALTAVAVYATIQYTDTDKQKWLGIAVLALVAGVSNHLWEAAIVLPIVVILGYHREYRWSSVFVIVTTVSVVAVYLLTELQPNPASPSHYAVVETGFSIFFTTGFWLRFLTRPFSPFYLGHSSLFYPGLVLGAYFFYRLVTNRSIGKLIGKEYADIVVLSWLAAGAAIPFGLPGGLNHQYYLWGLVLPVTLALSGILELVYQNARMYNYQQTAQRAVHLLLAVLVMTALLNAAVFEAGIGINGSASTAAPVFDLRGEADQRFASDPITGKEAVETGYALRNYQIQRVNEIVFVNSGTELSYITIYRVITYSNLEVRGVWKPSLDRNATTGPRYITGSPEGLQCTVIIMGQSDGSLDIKRCNHR
ncbi:hypothetical protein GRX01_10925 [Halobaculum sp. WSA2]|uniref:Glycosyltransferase RgtA/B/C/D-like domain-containing protein n=1 Tax=Halobaculum saliterrae TaxID=2073113 RepID=A0A6B0SWD5_9EURY|nr:glycosyltransferase family 39 protein [Halobaculum saliterrae]MXR41846.1 hypothetical protein [Halobaculum saliterrae]